MKPVTLIGLAVLLLGACTTAKHTSKTSATLIQSTKDSTEYEDVILDQEFDHWYLTQYTPAKDHLNDYYRTKNLLAIANWNDYYLTGKYSRLIESYINYHPDTDYGIEVNRKLYWYFTWFSEKYRIRLFGVPSSAASGTL